MSGKAQPNSMKPANISSKASLLMRAMAKHSTCDAKRRKQCDKLARRIYLPTLRLVLDSYSAFLFVSGMPANASDLRIDSYVLVGARGATEASPHNTAAPLRPNSP